MKYFLIITIYGFILMGPFLATHSRAQNSSNPSVTTFFHVLNDVPVMPGLRELTEEGINFDKPEGRIIAATAVSDTLRPEVVAQYYSQTLPQLGWTPQPDGSFLRGQERLRLIIEAKEGVSIVRVQVEPR